MKKLNRKGFTLVELLAVIIILAIVVGLTIPAVLTVTSNTKKKAFTAAADSMADWFDRQYQASLVGVSDVVTVDSNFRTFCMDKIDTNNDNVADKAKCLSGAQQLNATIIAAAGVRADNISTDGSTVYIDEDTGRACVTLKAATGKDYPDGAVECGGVCSDSQCTSTNN